MITQERVIFPSWTLCGVLCMASSYRKIAISEHVADVTTSSASVVRF